MKYTFPPAQHKGYLSVLTLIAMCGLSAFAVPTYAAPSLVVNTNNDLANNPSGTTSLREAITFANSNGADDSITFASSIAGQTIAVGSELPALSNSGTVSISGPAGGVTISGSTSRILRVSAGANATLTGLTISNANISGSGGAILNSGTLTINASTLSNNVITGSAVGGAIYSTGALTINSSTLSGNSAGSSGGAVYSTGAVTISNSTFSGNSAVNSGGAIYVTKALTVGNSTFSGNSAMNGGAIRNDATNGILTLDSSTISGNTATSFGGGIFSNSAAVSGADPTASFTLIRNSTLSDNSGNIGGAIYNSRGLVNIQNSTIVGNAAPSGAGVMTPAASRTRVKNTIIAANGNDVDGGTNSFVSDGYNVIGNGNASAAFNATGDKVGAAAAPLNLGALANNGGPTKTRALLSGSVAIDAGDPSFNGSGQFDQRGSVRVDGQLDVGAFEQNGNAAPTLENGVFSASLNAAFSYPIVGNDADAGDTLTYAKTGADVLPGNVTVASNGTVSGTPDATGVFPFDVTVTDSSGATATARFSLTVVNRADGVAPRLTHVNIPASLTRDDLAGINFTGKVQDLAPTGVDPTGVRRVQIQLRNSAGEAYNGTTFAASLAPYYGFNLGAGGVSDERDYSRALSFVPSTMDPGAYSFALYGLDNVGNYGGLLIPFTIVAPAAKSAPSTMKSAPSAFSAALQAWDSSNGS